MDIAKNREEYGLIKTDLSKQKIGDKECFKIFYPRFFAWVNLFLLNHILLYSLLLPFQSIQTYVAGFLFFEWSISFAYSHPFVCFV